MRWSITGFTICLMLSCHHSGSVTQQQAVVFVPYSVVTQQRLTTSTILPLFNENIAFIELVDSNAQVTIRYVNMDGDPTHEMIVQLLDGRNDIYKYYFLDYADEKWKYVNEIVYCCEGLADTIPSLIDTANQIIWKNERVWGSEIEGYTTYGFRLAGNNFDTVAILPGVMFESFINPQVPSESMYTGHLFREWYTVNDTLIELEVLCNINKRLAPQSNFYENTFSHRYVYQMFYDPGSGKYLCKEKLGDIRFPPRFASDIVYYEELKNNRKLVQ